MIELSLELRLIAACVRPLADERRLDAIRDAASVRFDAEQVVTLAHRHRVEGFVKQGLAAAGVELPASAARRLATSAAAARLKTLRSAGEEVRVGQAFAAAGIDAIFIKGATLGMRVHGTTALKTSWDVDVLVSRDQQEAAGAVLRDLGYRLWILGGIEDPVKVRRFLAAHKEAEWRHEGRETVAELHTELADNTAAIPTIGLGSPRETVDLTSGGSLATLATAPLFAYLCYHGSSHLWARLKWLADVAALLRDENIARLHDEAVALGAGRTPGVAILLAHELLGLDAPAPLLYSLRGDRVIRRLRRYSIAAIIAEQDERGRLARPFRELLAYARAQAWLVPGTAHRRSSIQRFLMRPYLPHHLAVPRWAVPGVILGGLPIRLLMRPLRLHRES
ncbi:nucleotidyltransferase family protein [Sphingomonas sp. HHU CXW]|uniref:Nucleotidyltransferase family protein n=1 Tax=Sphingomonas hominis TaxID=2741495 RepID=A0ABX2JJM9_9SPHN|nr:nucleotidyltransferase family protein [Sphingomonas hominis]NTS66845.1 nucleotidyltransferase family protein [Sphingomonas hominis]